MSADSTRRTMSMKGKAGKSILALLLVMLFVFFVYKPPVMAEDIPEGEAVSEETSSGLAVSSEAPGEDTAGAYVSSAEQEAHAEGPAEGAGTRGASEDGSSAENGGQSAPSADQDIDSDPDVERVPLETPSGTATVAEVVEGTGEEENNIVSDDQKSFSNDAPSVTITETYVTNDTSETPPEDKIYGMEPTNTEYTITDTGEFLDKNSQAKVKTTGAEVTVTAGEPVTPEAPEGSTGQQDPEVTITKTTVTKSESAIEKAVRDALSKATRDTKSIAITVAAGTYNGDIDIKARPTDNVSSDMVLYILGAGSYTEPDKDKIIDKTSLNEGADPSVVVRGNINIDGINVIMAGIYLSMDHLVNIKG